MADAPAPQMVPLKRLVQAEWNANRVPDATLAKVRRSIEEFGLVENLVARRHPSSRGKLEVLSGNHRLEILREMGLAEAPVVVVELGDADARILAQTLNRTRGQEDDPVAYAALLDVVLTQVGVGRALEFLPESESSIDRVLRAFGPAPEVDPDEAPPVPVEPRSVRGEVYELGPHRVMCGDATSGGDVDALMRDDRASLLFTSPPYLDARDYGGADLSVEHLASFLAVFAERADLQAVNLGIIRRDNRVVPYWNTYIDVADRAGLALLSWNVWDREQPQSIAQQTAMFLIEHEWVFVFGAERIDLNLTVENETAGTQTGRTNRQKDGTLKVAARSRVRDYRALGTVFRSPPHIGRDIGHPAMFPVVLPAAYIKAATAIGDAVVDPFTGSGSTLIGCEQLGRRALCMEIEPAYCDVIRQRYADFTNRPELAP